MNKVLKLICKLVGIGLVAYAALFAVFYFDMDGKALFYGVEPFLVRHYDSMERKDMTKNPYEMNKFPKYEYKV